MQTAFIVGGIIWVLLTAFLCTFIIYFGRRKSFSVRLGFYYILLFFILGVLLLAVTIKS